jgi:hypothetical protein
MQRSCAHRKKPRRRSWTGPGPAPTSGALPRLTGPSLRGNRTVRGMMVRGITARHCLCPIPLTTIPLTNLPGLLFMCLLRLFAAIPSSSLCSLPNRLPRVTQNRKIVRLALSIREGFIHDGLDGSLNPLARPPNPSLSDQIRVNPSKSE